MNYHDCDGPDCCLMTKKDEADANAFLNEEIGFEEFEERLLGRYFMGTTQERLAFLETRRVELQEMCSRQCSELIEARERIAYLERLIGRMYAESTCSLP